MEITEVELEVLLKNVKKCEIKWSLLIVEYNTDSVGLVHNCKT
jgi:hypothetical protein